MAVDTVDTGPARVRRRMREAMETHDHAAVVSLLAPDVVLRSPIIGTAFEGREAVGALLGAVLEEFKGSDYTGDGEVGDRQVLHFSARVRGLDIDGVDAMRVNDDGLVEHIQVYIRPMVGLAAVAAALGPHLARGPVQRMLVSALTVPLVGLLKLAEPLIPRLVWLRRG
ncbi:MAG: hypothetical protein QOI65_2170 [Thermoleophilaceae bacterium]|nr:hypothetical protein [Thermoleophilaceae bacterium]